MYEQADKIKELIDQAKNILVIQADNPDADSLGSALALEDILEKMDKKVYLQCSVDMPSYLRYMKGWDRVNKDIPSTFDLTIIEDASTLTLLEKLIDNGQINKLKSKPLIVLDHHAIVENTIPFETIKINDAGRASAGELIYVLCKQLKWVVSKEAQEFIMSSILGDTQGLSNSLASSETYRIMAEMVENGVNRPKLEETRREYSKMTKSIYEFKAELIQRTKFTFEDRIAYIELNQKDINEYSPQYNPAPLINMDMLSVEHVLLTIVFKCYADGKLTGAIRSNQTAPMANKLAESMGGGGHSFASGFKIDKTDDMHESINKCLQTAESLLKEFI
jgi:phosphoesterase RecJ-like protein